MIEFTFILTSPIIIMTVYMAIIKDFIVITYFERLGIKLLYDTNLILFTLMISRSNFDYYIKDIYGIQIIDVNRSGSKILVAI